MITTLRTHVPQVSNPRKSEYRQVADWQSAMQQAYSLRY